MLNKETKLKECGLKNAERQLRFMFHVHTLGELENLVNRYGKDVLRHRPSYHLTHEGWKEVTENEYTKQILDVAPDGFDLNLWRKDAKVKAIKQKENSIKCREEKIKILREEIMSLDKEIDILKKQIEES